VTSSCCVRFEKCRDFEGQVKETMSLVSIMIGAAKGQLGDALVTDEVSILSSDVLAVCEASVHKNRLRG
jgi:hypothetical protein